MTVQELINELNKVQNKSQKVYWETDSWSAIAITGLEEKIEDEEEFI